MNLVELWQLAVRQKVVVALMAVVSIAALVWAYGAGVPSYRSASTVVLFKPEAGGGAPHPTAPSATDTTIGMDNAFDRFHDMAVVNDIVSRVMSSRRVRAELVAEGMDGTYFIGANINQAGSIIDVTGESSSPDGAQKVTELVVAKLRDEVITLQDDQRVPPSVRITTAVPVGATEPIALFPSSARRVAAVGLLGASATLAVALGADAVQRRRRRGHDGDGVRRVVVDVG